MEELELISAYITLEPAEISELLDTAEIAVATDMQTVLREEDLVAYHDGIINNATFSMPDIVPFATSTAINGSYHFTKVVGKDPVIAWHNQTTDTDTVCSTYLKEPHGGDGNSRYRSGSGYKWFPNYVKVDFVTDIYSGQNRTQLWYKYDQSQLNNLQQDDNEALEMEVVFYNYLNATAEKEKGSSYQYHKTDESSSWATNQPNAYIDTTFSDNNDEISFCVGVDDAADLTANTWYFWLIDGWAGTEENNYVNDGRFKVTAQRGYRYNGAGTWSVFAEEHEPILSLGITEAQRWVADKNAWDMARDGEVWNFESGTDPVKG